MQALDLEAKMLTDRIRALDEPYQQNTIAWLESCAQRPLRDLPVDLRGFLVGLPPIVREGFVLHTRWILDEALAHFGRRIPTV